MTLAIVFSSSSFIFLQMCGHTALKSFSLRMPISLCVWMISATCLMSICSTSSSTRFPAREKSKSSFASACTILCSPVFRWSRARAIVQRRLARASCESSAARRPFSFTSSPTICDTNGLCCPTTSHRAKHQSTLEAESAFQEVALAAPRARAVAPMVTAGSPRQSSGNRVRLQTARARVSTGKPTGGVLQRSCTRMHSFLTCICLANSSRNLYELLVAIVHKASIATTVVKFAPFSFTMLEHFTAEASSTWRCTSLFSGAAAAAAPGNGGAATCRAACCCHCAK
mmetsp:Transcript_86843/g.186036  ORF Transcript_86843/g.186036 Transcript_86843/m.186036 type:complete len:285 (+) Transcript_86843:204-1058(+)